MVTAPMLEVSDVSKHFGGVTAVDQVSFTAQEGSVVALIGPNGAGKTTLFNAMTGFGPPDSGTVAFYGKPVQSLAPHRVARLGMVRTFQTIRMLGDLTVGESLLVARPRTKTSWTKTSLTKTSRTKTSRTKTSRTEHRERANAVIDRLGLGPLADRVCATLPLLAQRKVEVARALMCDPRLVLLDEPTAGATVAERQELAAIIVGLREAGTNVMVIEHNVPFVMDVSDQIVVLNYGEMVANGTPGEIARDPIVQEVYLGR